MTDRSIELFTAIFTALSGDATLTGLLGGPAIYNGVKDGTPPPYVDIGDDTAIDDSGINVDAQEHTITLHTWTQQPIGGQSAKNLCMSIMVEVRNVLHEARLLLNNGALCNMRQEFRETLRDPDGVSWHGVQRFRAVTNS